MKYNLLFFILAITYLNQTTAFTTIFQVNVQCRNNAKSPTGWKNKVEFVNDFSIRKACTFSYTGAADVVKGIAAEAIKKEVNALAVVPAGKANAEFEYKIVNLENNENITIAEKDGGWKAAGSKFKLGNYKNCHVLVRSSRPLNEIKGVASAIILAVTTTDLTL